MVIMSLGFMEIYVLHCLVVSNMVYSPAYLEDFGMMIQNGRIS